MLGRYSRWVYTWRLLFAVMAAGLAAVVSVPLMVFKSIRGSLSTLAPTLAFSVATVEVIQDHPAYIPLLYV